MVNPCRGRTPPLLIGRILPVWMDSEAKIGMNQFNLPDKMSKRMDV